jgi:hypothetical protein
MTPWQHRLFKRHVAYRQCFLGENGELTPAARIVLADLAKFGNVTVSPTVVSPVSRVTDVPATMQRVGRGEVFFRVWRYLRLPINQLFDTMETSDE